MAMCGYVWLFVTMCGYVWLCVAMYSYVWLFMHCTVLLSVHVRRERHYYIVYKAINCHVLLNSHKFTNSNIARDREGPK